MFDRKLNPRSRNCNRRLEDIETMARSSQTYTTPSDNHLNRPNVWLSQLHPTEPTKYPSAPQDKVSFGDFNLISRLPSGSTNDNYKVTLPFVTGDKPLVLKASDGSRIWGEACVAAITKLNDPPPPPSVKREQLPSLHFVGTVVNPRLQGAEEVENKEDLKVAEWPGWPKAEYKTLHIEVEDFREIGNLPHLPAYYGRPDFDILEVQKFSRSLLTLLSHAHSRGVMNKDLHSGNIWWDPTAELAIVIDWNGADLFEGEGTPKYIHVEDECTNIQPPEAYEDPSAIHVNAHHFDVWSVGVLLGWLFSMSGPLGWYGHTGWYPPHVIGLPGGRMEGDDELDKPGIRSVINLIEIACEEDPRLRPSAEELLRHPFFQEDLTKK